MKGLQGRVALVTGASRGIGPVIAEALLAEGMRVALSARSAADLESVRGRLDPSGERVAVFPADIADGASAGRLIEDASRHWGVLDVLVNNAGVEQVSEFVETDFAAIEQMVRLNIVATVRMTQLALPGMLERRSGHVVNVASLAGLAPVPFNAVYSATKHAVVGFSESLRLELEGSGVSVSAVCPGYVREAGMFSRHGRRPPALTGSSSPQDVARAVISAIKSDKGVVIVAPGLAKFTPAIRGLIPGALRMSIKRGGVFDMMRNLARGGGDSTLSSPPSVAADEAELRGESHIPSGR